MKVDSDLVPPGHQDAGRARDNSPGQERLTHTDLAFNIVIFKLEI